MFGTKTRALLYRRHPWKKCSVFGAFRFSAFQIKYCVPAYNCSMEFLLVKKKAVSAFCIAIDTINNSKTCKNTHTFRILAVNLYKVVLICKFKIITRGLKYLRKELRRKLVLITPNRMQFNLRQLAMQSGQY